jgi:hypothetical protein
MQKESAELKRANDILKAVSAFSPANSIRSGDSPSARGAAREGVRGRGDMSAAGDI